ncbi:MAG TPA: hypothetical protein VM734_15775 [Kofleriaceae bacterium]|nr:hypothetical protein [Kofleriaceae bacterium]
MRIVLLDEAQRQFELEDAWWRAHRDAQDLFLDEFEQALAHLSASPESGQHYRHHRGRSLRRWLMPKTRCHIYYVHDTGRDVLEVHSVWGARRGRGPAL